MLFLHLNDIEERTLFPGSRARFIHSDQMTFAHWNFKSGAVLPEHSHHHEQVATCILGEFDLTINGETRTLTPGAVVIIPSGAPHSGAARADSYMIDVFCPVREDLR
ncbi:MAG: cupin domain-containing protein [Geobacteraceae bacterium]